MFDPDIVLPKTQEFRRASVTQVQSFCDRSDHVLQGGRREVGDTESAGVERMRDFDFVESATARFEHQCETMRLAAEANKEASWFVIFGQSLFSRPMKPYIPKHPACPLKEVVL